MTDKHVDDLLADLDRALAVEPSPAVMARVRTRIAERPATGWFGRNWRLVCGGGAAAAVVLAAVFAVWPRTKETPTPTQMTATGPAHQPATIPPAAPVVAPAPAAAAVTPTRSRARAAAPRRLTPVPVAPAVEPEPEVLVSPGVRLALAQLAAAVRDGRISADAIPPDGPIVLPDPIVIQTYVVEPLKLDLVPGNSGGSGVR